MITMIWYVRQYIWWLWIQDIWLLQMAEVQAKLDEVEKAGAAGRNEVSSIFFKFQGALDIALTWWWTDSSHTFLQVKFCPLIKSFVWWHDATQDQWHSYISIQNCSQRKKFLRILQDLQGFKRTWCKVSMGLLWLFQDLEGFWRIFRVPLGFHKILELLRCYAFIFGALVFWSWHSFAGWGTSSGSWK